MIAPYRTEDEAMACFDLLAEQSGCFRIYKEVGGEMIQPRFGCEEKTVRIDRVLIPLQRLLNAGWVHGPIGVEGKRHDEKAGKAICQALDYHRAIFDLGTADAKLKGFRFSLECIFLWPFEPERGEVASVMAQNRLGCCFRKYDSELLRFTADQTIGIQIKCDGVLFVQELKSGRKVGSR